MVDILSEDQRQRVEAAVAAAEAQTSAEIVVMVTPRSVDYQSRELIAAAVAALALPAVLLPFASVPALTIWMAQLALFGGLATLLPRLGAGRFLVSSARVQEDVHGAARAAFFAYGLRRTSQRAAVLVYVSMAEHHVEILADDGAAAVVSDDAWQGVTTDLAGAIKAHQLTEGLDKAAGDIAALLSDKLPPKTSNPDELPNVIVG